MSGYIVNTPFEQKEMLKTLGMESLDDLYASVPKEAKLKESSGSLKDCLKGYLA